MISTKITTEDLAKVVANTPVSEEKEVDSSPVEIERLFGRLPTWVDVVEEKEEPLGLTGTSTKNVKSGDLNKRGLPQFPANHVIQLAHAIAVHRNAAPNKEGNIVANASDLLNAQAALFGAKSADPEHIKLAIEQSEKRKLGSSNANTGGHDFGRGVQ